MMSELQGLVKKALGTDTLTRIGTGGGCISSGTSYRTQDGTEVYVKENSKEYALRMFAGEEESLKAMLATNTLHCPRPLKLLADIPGGGAAIILEHLNLGSAADEAALGEGLARMHMHNWKLTEAESDEGETRFGFSTVTSCGYLPQSNKWNTDWVEFYCEKIDYQMGLLESGRRSEEARSLWSQFRPRVPKLFEGLVIRPSLLHGDLWSGNAGYTPQGPVIFDAASFYGHNEYDLGIDQLCPQFGREFYKAYHSLIPKEKGYELRLKVYKLFHILNHWNSFGGGYGSQETVYTCHKSLSDSRVIHLLL